MANNIGYKASIDVDWVTFKEQPGVEISDSGKTLETRDVIPSNLKLIVLENTSGVTREATITFTQEGGEKKTVTLRQNKSKAGRYQDGEPYLDTNKSGLVIKNKFGIDKLDISGGTVNFTATYKKVYSANWYETDDDGNEINRWVEDSPASGEDVTSSSTCTWTVSPVINSSKIDNGKLTIGENTSNGSPIFSVNATYKDSSGNTFTSNTLTVNQAASPVDWIFTVKTNNPNTIVYFLSTVHFLNGDTEFKEVKEIYHEEAKLKDNAYYSTYSTSGFESPNISAYIVKDDVYTLPKIKLYEKDTETELKDKQWNVSSSGGSMELDAVYEVSKTTYKVDNDSANTKTLVDGETFEINSNEDETVNIKKRTSGETDSSWLSIKSEGDANNDENFTYSISAENNASDSVREGHIDFRYIDDKNEIPSAETPFNVSQQYRKFTVTPSAITISWDDSSNSGVTISSTESD